MRKLSDDSGIKSFSASLIRLDLKRSISVFPPVPRPRLPWHAQPWNCFDWVTWTLSLGICITSLTFTDKSPVIHVKGRPLPAWTSSLVGADCRCSQRWTNQTWRNGILPPPTGPHPFTLIKMDIGNLCFDWNTMHQRIGSMSVTQSLGFTGTSGARTGHLCPRGGLPKKWLVKMTWKWWSGSSLSPWNYLEQSYFTEMWSTWRLSRCPFF